MTKLIVVVALLCAIQLSCATSTSCQDPKNASSVECVVVNSVVDCTGITSLASAVAVVGPIVDNLLASVIQPDGSIVWASIEPQLITLAWQYGMCTIAAIWNDYINGVPPSTGSARIARAKPAPAALAAEFERIRARVAPNQKFKISGATL